MAVSPFTMPAKTNVRADGFPQSVPKQSSKFVSWIGNPFCASMGPVGPARPLKSMWSLKSVTVQRNRFNFTLPTGSPPLALPTGSGGPRATLPAAFAGGALVGAGDDPLGATVTRAPPCGRTVGLAGPSTQPLPFRRCGFSTPNFVGVERGVAIGWK
eukprot:gene932-biopygen22701